MLKKMISYQAIKKDATPQFDAKLRKILRLSAALISREGYERASMRKVARETGMSLAGLYHYFGSKEELLFLIQLTTFDSLVRSLKDKSGLRGGPEIKLEMFIRNHLDFFCNHMNELKICAHEIESLGGSYYRDVAAKRREYFKAAVEILRELSGDGTKDSRKRSHENLGLSALYLFGALNWIYMWYDPKRYPGSREMAAHLTSLFLRGFPGSMKGHEGTSWRLVAPVKSGVAGKIAGRRR